MNTKELALDSIWKLHKQYKDFEMHYSNVRVTLCSFIIIVAGYVGNKTLDINNFSKEGNDLLIIAPVFILLVNVFLSNWLFSAQKICIKAAKELEENVEKIIKTGVINETNNAIYDFTFPKRNKSISGIQIISPKYFESKEIGNLLFLSFYFLSICFGFLAWATPNILCYWSLFGLILFCGSVLFLVLAHRSKNGKVCVSVEFQHEDYENLKQRAKEKKLSVACFVCETVNNKVT